jgi:hypothetical protein
MNGLIDKILDKNDYSNSAASDIAKYDFELIRVFLNKKYQNHQNIFENIDVKQFMGLFVNWITYTWWKNPFLEKYWILCIKENKHHFYYQIRGFDDLDEFSKTKEFTYEPSIQYEDIELTRFLNYSIDFDNFSRECANDIVVGMVASHLKLMKQIADEMKANEIGYDQSLPFQIGFYFNHQLKVLFSVER